MRTESSAALKFLYPVVVRVTGLCGVMLLIFTFLVFPRSRNTMELDEEVQIIIEQIDIKKIDVGSISEGILLKKYISSGNKLILKVELKNSLKSSI